MRLGVPFILKLHPEAGILYASCDLVKPDRACASKIHCWDTHKRDILRASLVVQMGKNLPAMQETKVQSLGWKDPL